MASTTSSLESLEEAGRVKRDQVAATSFNGSPVISPEKKGPPVSEEQGVSLADWVSSHERFEITAGKKVMIMAVDGTHKETQKFFQNKFEYRRVKGMLNVADGTQCEIEAPFAGTSENCNLKAAKVADLAVGVPLILDKKPSFDSEHLPICIVEVTSDGNPQNDLEIKRLFYQHLKVPDYVIVHRSANTVLHYTLNRNIYDVQEYRYEEGKGNQVFVHPLFGCLELKDIFAPRASDSAAERIEEEKAKVEEEKAKVEEEKAKAEEEKAKAEEGKLKAEEGKLKAEEEARKAKKDAEKARATMEALKAELQRKNVEVRELKRKFEEVKDVEGTQQK